MEELEEKMCHCCLFWEAEKNKTSPQKVDEKRKGRSKEKQGTSKRGETKVRMKEAENKIQIHAKQNKKNFPDK